MSLGDPLQNTPKKRGIKNRPPRVRGEQSLIKNQLIKSANPGLTAILRIEC